MTAPFINTRYSYSHLARDQLLSLLAISCTRRIGPAWDTAGRKVLAGDEVVIYFYFLFVVGAV